MSAAAAAITERNRANAQHSTGPKTAEGRAASSQNARKHGLTGQLRLDSQAETERFTAKCAEYTAFFKLTHPDAERVIREIVTAQFRMEQIWKVQRTLLTMLQEQYIDELNESVTDPEEIRNRLAAIVYLRDPENGNVLQRLHRYLLAAERSHRRARAELDKLRAEQSDRVRAEAEMRALQQRFQANKTKLQNEPSRHPAIDVANLPWLPLESKIHVNIPQQIKDMVRNPPQNQNR